MKLSRVLIFALLLLNNNPLKAQFFQKLEDDFTFNGISLARYRNENSTKNCTLLQQTEWGDEFQPPKDELKTKKFTLKQIRYYTDLTEANRYVWLITAICTGDFIEQAELRMDMGKGAIVDNISANGMDDEILYSRFRTHVYYLKRPGSDTVDVLIRCAVDYDTPEVFTKTHPFMDYMGQLKTDHDLRNYLFYC